MPQSVTNKPQAQIQSLQKKWDKLQYLLLARHILAVSVGTAIGLGYLFLGEGITTPGFSVVAGAIPALALEVLTWVPAVFIRGIKEENQFAELNRFRPEKVGTLPNQLQKEEIRQASKTKKLQSDKRKLAVTIKAREDELAPLRSEIEGLKRNSRDLTTKMQGLEGAVLFEKDKAQKQLGELEATKKQLEAVKNELAKANKDLKGKKREIDRLNKNQRDISNQLIQIQREQAAKVTALQEAERKIISLEIQTQQVQTALQQANWQIDQKAAFGADPQDVIQMQQLHQALQTLLHTSRARPFKRQKARLVVSESLRGDEKQRNLLRQVIGLLKPEERAKLTLKPIYGDGIAEMVNELDLNTWPTKRLLLRLRDEDVMPVKKREILEVLQAKFSYLNYAQIKSLRRALYPLFELPEIADVATALLSRLDHEELNKAFVTSPQLAVEDIATANLPVPYDRISDAKQMIQEVVGAHPTLAETGKIACGVIDYLYGSDSPDILMALLQFLSDPATAASHKKFLLEKIIRGDVIFDHESIVENVRTLLQSLTIIAELRALALQALRKVIPATVVVDGSKLRGALGEGNDRGVVEEMRIKEGELRAELKIQVELQAQLQGQAQLIERLSEELKVFLDEDEDPLFDPFANGQQPASVVPTSRAIRRDALHSAPWEKILQPIQGYDLLREIASGGFGQVIAAINLATGREVMIKRIHLHLLDDLDSKEDKKRDDIFNIINRFKTEAEMLMSFAHPNVMKVFRCEVELTQGRRAVYYEGELVKGPFLAKLIRRKKLLSVPEALNILYFMVLGLEALSDEKNGRINAIYHRDLKPDNVVITSFKRRSYVKLVDFGLAKHVASDGSLTSLGTMGGTANYLAPESVDCGLKGLDHHADIYALALILYKMLTGKLPRKFEGQAKEIWVGFVDWARNKAKPTFSYAQLEQFSPAIQLLLSNMGEKNVEYRINSYRGIREMIEQILIQGVTA
ncbi:hypothetical protein COT42_04910 [Candidatus Saganbacteria bacterium CG08_land_8_20_14_0_20_45_16]|uniref:Protein kinase domain-containing protein n=1 Tax=Candidatus Saganbacteria bacterium CG08_land_8_20_14_0_20_45_16 TaxID=2014293 RepID=A0A2H0XXH2_UNCSA|nr:MAG: hypothetical protein COT42_04910 [Candidatus Saganbacteria bacterium CG08_land_8_20_14_0_20_45_16]